MDLLFAIVILLAFSTEINWAFVTEWIKTKIKSKSTRKRNEKETVTTAD